MDPLQEARAVRFGDFELDLGRQELRRNGVKLALRPQSFQVLALLVRRPGEVVTREELIGELWGQGEVIVEYEPGLNAVIARLRQLLDDSARSPRFIATEPRRGYRFVAPVAAIGLEAERPPASQGQPWIAATLALLAVLGLALVAVAGMGWPRSSPTPPASPYMPDPAAHDEYLKGVYLLEQEDRESLRRALEKLETAVRIDDEFAPAHAGAATAHTRLAFLESSTTERWTRARRAAERALELDDSLAEAHIALGLVQLYHDWDFGDAHRSLRIALELAPSLGEAHGALAAYLAAVGETDEAVTQARLARRLDPRRLSVRADLCWYLNYARRFGEAQAECRRALELAPGHPYSALGLAEALRQQGLTAAAAEWTAAAFGSAAPTADPSATPSPSAADAAASERLRARWQSILRAVTAPGADEPPPYFVAAAGALAGEPETAFRWLERAFEQRSPALLYFTVDPRLTALEDDPRFDQLARRIGLPHPR